MPETSRFRNRSSKQLQKSNSAALAKRDRLLRKQLVWLLESGNAHADFNVAIAGLPANLRGAKPADCPYSPWQLLEHMRIAQWDILEFSQDPRHVTPDWPAGFWPKTKTSTPPNPQAWNNSVRSFRQDLKAMQRLIADPANDLFAPLPHGEGQTLLREALLLADHNSYHLGELILVRRLLGAWPS